jgi:hypothetical protein
VRKFDFERYKIGRHRFDTRWRFLLSEIDDGRTANRIGMGYTPLDRFYKKEDAK